MPTISPAAWDDPEVAQLTAAQQAELRSRHDGAVEALSRGWTTLRLETGPRQPEAVGLYTRAGYEPAAAFGSSEDDQDSLFLARGLT
ncbi:hypothetical protein [Modestobacter sp. I12A-02662]|uniref:hypothetical protein n=1 Tax=Modestobacter sp. I12A-02662 TaxID=1730496 RepID=UPI0034DFE248